MRFVLFADSHLDAKFAWLSRKPAAARKRREAIRDAVRAIIDLARERQADALLCAGDLFEDSRVTGDTMHWLSDQLAGLENLPVYIAPGNHDPYSGKSAYHSHSWPANVTIFRGDRLEPIILDDGVTLWGGAHTESIRQVSFVDGFQAGRGGVNLGLFHASERGWATDGRPKYAEFQAGDIARAGLDFAFLGHIHTPKDDAAFIYPGNPAPLTFGETGERGAVVVDLLGDGRIRHERVTVSGRDLAEIAVDISGCTNGTAVRDRVRDRLAGERGCIRLSLEGEIDPEVDLPLAEIEGLVAPGVDDISVTHERLRFTYDFDALAREETARGLFIRAVRADTALSPGDRDAILLMGLRAFDGRTAFGDL